jgi:cholesterol transport system auxiliary component
VTPRSIFTLILGVAMIVSVGGCVSLLPKTTPAQLYRFGVDAPASPTPAKGVIESPSGAGKIGLVLGAIGFPRASTSDGILTVTGDQTAYLSGVRWVAPARTLFQEAVQRAFDARSKQAQIVSVGDVGPAGGVLRLDVTAFEARYPRPGAAPSVAISVVARLNRADGRLLDQRDFSILIPARANSVSMIVKAFDQATDTLLADLVAWSDAQTATLTAGSPPSATVSTSTTATSVTTTTDHR